MITKSVLKRILKLLLGYKKELILTLIFNLLISIIGLVDSLLLSYLIDNVLYSNAKRTLTTIAIVMLLIAFLQTSLKGLKSLFIQNISYKIDVNLTREFYNHVLELHYSFFEKHKTGELTSRLNDTRIVRDALSEGLIGTISNIIMFLVVGCELLKLNKILFLIQLIAVIILSCIVLWFVRFFSKSYPESMEKYANVQAFVIESFGGIESIKTYPANNSFKKKFDIKQNESIKIGWNIGEHCILQSSYCNVIEKICSILLLVFGLLFVMNEKMSLGQVASFISLSGIFTNSVGNLLDLQSGIQEAFAAIKRLFEVLDEESDQNLSLDCVETVVPELKFQNVCFSYNKNTTFYENLNLEIKSGQWISFIGKTGCGKTTIVKLLLKLYKPHGEIILWNNEDLQKINTASIRKIIGYVPQDVILFSGTIFDNITMFSDEYSKEYVLEITKKVGIYEKILSLENGLDTIVGENGFSLSGGEKQKIAICRVLIKNPQVIVMDEATSSLDLASEKEIIKIIEQQKKEGKTIISIAHRLSTVEKCDNIYVLDKGKIIESGNFEKLMNDKGLFFNILNMQRFNA